MLSAGLVGREDGAGEGVGVGGCPPHAPVDSTFTPLLRDDPAPSLPENITTLTS